jgi:hypothetical protein
VGRRVSFGGVNCHPLRRTLALAVALAALLAMAARAGETPLVEFRLKHGDDPRWAERDWDDRDWPVVGRTDGRAVTELDIIPARTGIFWLRYRIERSARPSWGLNVPSFLWPADEPGTPVNSVFLAGTMAHEFYWDGHLIGRSGRVGASRAAEVPGRLDHLMVIPDALLGPGPHVVAMRISTYHYNFPPARFRISPVLGNYGARLSSEARQPIIPLVGAGCSALVAVICAVLFGFVDRRRALVICGLLGLATAVFFTLIAWRWLYPEPYPWLHWRYAAMLAAMAAIGLLMIGLLVEQFSIPHKAWWLLGAGVIVAVVWLQPPFFQVRILWLGRALLGYALLPVAWALWHRRTGAWLALAGVLIGLGSVQQAADLRAVLSPAFFLFFGVLVILLLGALGWQMREGRRHAREAQLAAARLELELVKKNLQPHFLLNTLAVLTEIVERDPRGAVRLIDDLAEEFRAVSRVSAEKLIPLAQELELCRAHLRVMSARTGRAWTLETEGVDSAAPVPPAVFLTLIENGFMHQRTTAGAGIFRLRAQTTSAGAVRYEFLSPGEVQDAPTRPAGGTGLRYVKARLEESFPGRWSLTGEPVSGGWRTVIEIDVQTTGGRA